MKYKNIMSKTYRELRTRIKYEEQNNNTQNIPIQTTINENIRESKIKNKEKSQYL